MCQSRRERNMNTITPTISTNTAMIDLKSLDDVSLAGIVDGGAGGVATVVALGLMIYCPGRYAGSMLPMTVAVGAGIGACAAAAIARLLLTVLTSSIIAENPTNTIMHKMSMNSPAKMTSRLNFMMRPSDNEKDRQMVLLRVNIAYRTMFDKARTAFSQSKSSTIDGELFVRRRMWSHGYQMVCMFHSLLRGDNM